VADEDLKRALGGVFLRDVARVEPGKKGYVVSESLRIYADKGAYTLSFLRGTDEKSRKTVRDQLDTANVKYKMGPDFES
jgi:hypothetical protein